MKKGFTLIELLGILVILGTITLVAVPTVIGTNKKAKENDYNEFKKTIENAAEVYIETRNVNIIDGCNNSTININDLKSTNGSHGEIPLSDIIATGILSGSLEDPTKKKTINEIDGCVLVVNSNGKLEYSYGG